MTEATIPDIPALRALLEKATKGEWAYRPIEFDDWGVIRDVETGSIVAIARAGGDADLDAHRAAKTDPYEPNGALIVAVKVALPALLDAAEQNAKLRAALSWAVARGCDHCSDEVSRARKIAHECGV